MDLDLEPDVDQVDSGLYLGSLAGAQSPALLRSRSITHILTIDTEPLADQPRPQVKTMFIKADDRPHVDLLSHFDDAYNFIDEAMRHGAIFIHCFFGLSRSATIVIAFMMRKYQLSVQEATMKVKEKRPAIGPNPGFLAQLHLYEKMKWKLDPSNLEFKIFLLENFCAKLKKGRNFDEVQKIVAVDPGQHDSISPDAGVTVYRCRSCRRVLCASSNILRHNEGRKPAWVDANSGCWQMGEERDDSEDNSEASSPPCYREIFTEPIQWMTDAHNKMQGKLSCPKCEAKIGSFNWLGLPCACGARIIPAFHLHNNKVDESPIL